MIPLPKKETLITGLDIGSSKISAVMTEFRPGEEPSILAHANFPSKGVLRGALVDRGGATEAVAKTLARLGEKRAKELGDIYVSVSGQTVAGERSRGMIPLSLRGREVTKADMERAASVASTIRLAFDREIIHRIVNAYSIDDQPWLSNPEGLYASRLACEVYVITAGMNHIQNIYTCVNDAGYDVKEVVFSGIADGTSLLSDDERAASIAVVDMGSSLTNLSIFSGGALASVEVIPLGSGDVTGDLAASAALGEIITKIKARLDEQAKRAGAVAGLTMTGGMAFNEGIVDLLEARLGLPVKIGVVKDLRGAISGIEAMGMSTAVGLALYGHAVAAAKYQYERNLAGRLSAKVIDIFNNYF